MTPQAAVPRRPTAPVVPSPPSRVLRPDDLICGDCGEGNPPERRFCSRCGGSLQTATVVPTPWWRRLQKRFDRTARPAGSRPSRLKVRAVRGVFTAIRRALLVGLLLLGLLYAAVPSMRSQVNEGVLGIRDRVQALFAPDYVKVLPTSWSATAELPDHPPEAAVDLLTDTFWAAPGAADDPTLVLGFDRPTRLVRAIVRVGSGEDFRSFARPERLYLVYFADGNTIGTFDVELEDTPEAQEVGFSGGDGATSVEIHVVSTYGSSADNPRDVALTEIELFERR